MIEYNRYWITVLCAAWQTIVVLDWLTAAATKPYYIFYYCNIVYTLILLLLYTSYIYIRCIIIWTHVLETFSFQDAFGVRRLNFPPVRSSYTWISWYWPLQRRRGRINNFIWSGDVHIITSTLQHIQHYIYICIMCECVCVYKFDEYNICAGNLNKYENELLS